MYYKRSTKNILNNIFTEKYAFLSREVYQRIPWLQWTFQARKVELSKIPLKPCQWQLKKDLLGGYKKLHILHMLAIFNVFHPKSLHMSAHSLCRKKDVYAWVLMVAPLPLHRALPQTWVCLYTFIVTE